MVIPASLVPLLFVKPGVTKHHGKSYMFEPIHFASSTLQITALSQGELDLAAFGYTSFPLAIANAGRGGFPCVGQSVLRFLSPICPQKMSEMG